jgi:hypothetical protein
MLLRVLQPARFLVKSWLLGAACLLVLLLLSAPYSYGYSVLTHEAIVDSLWDASIQKMLLKRFPMATPEELEQAHAYVYGGCILQDMGYYPFSSRFFSDLTHYVRSGDFVAALIREFAGPRRIRICARYAGPLCGRQQRA